MKVRISTIIFAVVAVVYGIIMIGTIGSIFQSNKESEYVRNLYFLKSCEVEVLRKICLTACLEEVPKLGEYMIRINQAQQAYGTEKEKK